MPVSTESTITAVRETSERGPSQTLPYWEAYTTEGPADLYRGFALDAVDEILQESEPLEDDQIAILMQAVNVALSVVLSAAHVSTSWLPQYEAATAHLRDA